ncbi:MAG: DUF4430 domain-containing protein [Thermincola sp.]|jgi:hypothetical protein|nr:DUF4430 domain-containing protein [Thermincola sp.]MDT3703132.1 DUF4430 domain-containing protein [Thermincola sp.]
MKRKLIYFIALLVILAGAIGPALYMHKTVNSKQPDKQAENSKTVEYGQQEQGSSDQTEQGDSMDESRAAGDTQVSSAANKQQPAAATKQEVTVTKQQVTATKQQGSTSVGDEQANKPDSPASNNSVPVVAPASGCKVGIAVMGENGEFLFGPAQVIVKKDNKWGITALGALDATGIPYAMKPAWPDFVDSISGQACRGVSGWMFNVNGDVPMHMADKHPLKTGDKVIWWYSNSMDQPIPQWDELVQKK